MPVERRTRATLRSAEFGFFGVVVNTRVHVPRRWGAPFSAGVASLRRLFWRPLRTSCSIVGTVEPLVTSAQVRSWGGATTIADGDVWRCGAEHAADGRRDILGLAPATGKQRPRPPNRRRAGRARPSLRSVGVGTGLSPHPRRPSPGSR